MYGLLSPDIRRSGLTHRIGGTISSLTRRERFARVRHPRFGYHRHQSGAGCWRGSPCGGQEANRRRVLPGRARPALAVYRHVAARLQYLSRARGRPGGRRIPRWHGHRRVRMDGRMVPHHSRLSLHPSLPAQPDLHHPRVPGAPLRMGPARLPLRQFAGDERAHQERHRSLGRLAAPGSALRLEPDGGHDWPLYFHGHLHHEGRTARRGLRRHGARHVAHRQQHRPHHRRALRRWRMAWPDRARRSLGSSIW